MLLSLYLIAEQETANAEKMNGRPAIETITELETPTGPPVATVLARAQSYSDLSHAVPSNFPTAATSARKRSIGGDEKLDDALRSVLEYDDWQFTLEEELLDASHEDYEYVNNVDRGISRVLMQPDSINHSSSNHKHIWTPSSKAPIPR